MTHNYQIGDLIKCVCDDTSAGIRVGTIAEITCVPMKIRPTPNPHEFYWVHCIYRPNDKSYTFWAFLAKKAITEHWVKCTDEERVFYKI